MNTKSLLLISIFLFSTIHHASALCDSEIIDNNSVFNICPIVSAIQTYTDIPAGASVNPDITVNISFSTTPLTPCSGTPSNVSVFATIDDGSDCMNLAIQSFDLSAISSDDESEGLSFAFPANPATSGSYGPLTVQLTCDSAATNGSNINFTVISADSTGVIVSGASLYGCPVITLSMLTGFLEKYRIVFIIVFVVLGLITCFFGTQMFKVCIFIIAAVGGSLLSGSLFFEFTHMGTQKWALWLIFVVCIIIGLILGYVAIKIEAIGFIALGIVLGGVAGLFLYNAVLAPFTEGKRAVFYIVIAVMALIGAAVAYKLWKGIVIVGTAFIGSFMCIRALGVAFGGFPSEDSIAAGISSFSGVTYVYLVAILVLAIIGGIFQYKRQKRQEENFEDEDPHGYERVMGSRV